MKTVMITGATDGIGKETAKELARRNYNIIIHGRKLKKAKMLKNILEKINNQPEYYIAIADFSSQQQVINMALELKNDHDKINVLINNAGTYQNKLQYSEDGIEKTLAVNYHSHYILTLMLLDLIQKEDYSRIINFSSMVHSSNIDLDNIWKPDDYSGNKAYSDSKLCIILFTFYLAKPLDNTTVNCLHPGVINTKLLKKGWGIGGSSLKKGAKTPIYLADSDKVAGETGNYYAQKRKKQPARIAYNEKLQKKLWKKSKEQIRYDLDISIK
ncbi:MAG: SDR family NAD(P)-dependent oxidoreductase [Bacillota bacterium]